MRLLFRLLVFTCALLLTSSALASFARETVVELDDGSSVKVFLFNPVENDLIRNQDGPWPLCILMTGGSGNEYVARAQFWLGRELARRGWLIAVPISPNGDPFTGDNGQKIPDVINELQMQPEIQGGKALLVGVSTGGNSALELAVQHPEQYYGVVAVPGILNDLSLIDDVQGLPVYLRISSDDPFRWNRKMPALVNALRAGGARVNAALVEDANHVFSLDWNDVQQWLETLDLPSEPAPSEPLKP